MNIRLIYEQNKKNIPTSDLDCGFGETHSLWIRKFFNTFFYPRIYRYVVTKFVYEQALGLRRLNRYFYFVWKCLQKIFYFWPRPFNVTEWAIGGKGKSRTHASFKEVDDGQIKAIALIGTIIHSKDYSIVDLGCNSGRHLALFWQLGYRNLFGVDAMKEGISEFSKIYPDVYAASEIYHDTFENFLLKSAPRSFDVIFSWSATIELVHPSFNIVREICKVARYQVILVLNEGSQGYTRFWIYEFNRNGFDLSFALRPLDKNSIVGYPNTTSLCCFQRRNLSNAHLA